MVTYPAAFDAMWVTWYLHAFTSGDPFRRRCIDLKTLAMQLLGGGYANAAKRNMPASWFSGKRDTATSRSKTPSSRAISSSESSRRSGRSGERGPGTMRSAVHPGVPRLLKAAADKTLRQTSAIEAILLYGSRATGTHREDSDWDIAVVTELTRDEGFKAAGPLYADEVAEQHWTEIACTTRGNIERYANTAGTLESRIAREAVLIAGEWQRPACTQGRELEIDAGQALTWARVAAGNAMGAAAWLETASAERWKGDNEAGAKVQRMAEQVTKGILATFGVYESDIHDLERSADELENAYARSQWMEEERAQFATMVRGLKAKGRAALRAEEQDAR